jgi:hypothetical protein
MKFENKEGNVKVTNGGDSHKFTITDQSAVMVIDSLINLYSDPIGSLIRELVSNAVDANRERDLKLQGEVPLDAGDDLNNFAKDKPFVEVINQNGNVMLGVDHSIIIRDYGNGLSPERVAKVFTVLGTSTKRITDKLIGGYGIGAKSAFAYTDTFYVKATHNNVERMYMLYKGNALPEMTLVSEVAAEGVCNSTDVIIPLKSERDVEDFEEAINNQLLFFNNVVYKGFDTAFDIPIEVFSTENILVAKNTHTSIVGCIVGRVVYPIDYNLIPDLVDTSRKKVNAYLRFKIGEVDLVPSRESLRYTDKTIKAITDKFEQASKECAAEVPKLFEEETDFLTWYLSVRKAPTYNSSRWNSNSISDNEDKGAATMIQLGAVNTLSMDLTPVVRKHWPQAPENIYTILNSVITEDSNLGIEVKKLESYYSHAFRGTKKRLKITSILELFKAVVEVPRTFSLYHVPGKYSALKTTALHDSKFITFKTSLDVKLPINVNCDIQKLNRVKDFICEQVMKVHGNILNYDDIDTTDVDPKEVSDVSTKEYRKLNKTIFFKELYRDSYPNDKNWAKLPFVMVKEGLKIEELERYTQAGTEIIYGYSDDDTLLKMCGGILFSLYNASSSIDRTTLGSYRNGLNKYMIIKAAKNLSKDLAQFTYIKDFYMDKHEELITYMTSELCSESVARIKQSCIYYSEKSMRIIDPDVAKVFTKVEDRFTKYQNYGSNIYGSATLVSQVHEICTKEGLYDIDMVDSVKALIKYLDEFPVLESATHISNKDKVTEQLKVLKETLGVTLDKCPYLEEVEKEIPELTGE